MKWRKALDNWYQELDSKIINEIPTSLKEYEKHKTQGFVNYDEVKGPLKYWSSGKDSKLLHCVDILQN